MGDYKRAILSTCPPQVSKPEIYKITPYTATVSWEKPECNVCYYGIFWHCIGKFAETGNATSEITLHTITDLKPAHTYTITVSAINQAGAGESSEVLTFHTAPMPTNNVEVCKITESSVSLKYQHEDHEQKKFQIVITSLSNAKSIEKDIEGCFAFIDDLEHGESYHVVVYAIHEGKKSAPSNDIEVETNPTKVNVVHGKKSVNNSHTLSWDKVYGAVSYLVKWKKEGQNYSCRTTDDNEIVFEDLDLDREYTVYIAAVNSEGRQGQYSDPLYFTTVLKSPSNIVVQNNMQKPESSVITSFTPMSRSACTYDVKIVDVATGALRNEMKTKQCYAQFHDLQPGTYYRISVQAIHADHSKSSNIVYSLPIATGCSHIEEVSAKRLSKSSWLVSWNKVHGATEYVARYESLDSNSIEEKVSCTEIILKDLKLGKEYTVKVVAVNEAGPGKESRVVFKTDLAAPELIEVANTRSRPESSIYVKVTEHETKSSNRYKLKIEALSTDHTVEIVISRGKTVISDLKPGTQYIAHVCSCDVEDENRKSEFISSKPIWTCPSKVLEPELMVMSYNSRKISWKRVEGATSYEIKWKKFSDKENRMQVTGTGTEIALDNLDLNGYYSAWITAVNSAGHGESSSVTTFQTGLHPPSNVQVKISELNKQTSIEVKFTEPEQRANKYGIRVVHKDGKFKDITQVTVYNWATIRGLECGECYKVYVCSIHEKDEKLNSNEISSELIWTAPGKEKITTTKVSNNKQKLQWNSQQGANGYLVKWGIENSDIYEKKISQPEWILNDLSPGQDYVVSVAVINESGIGEESEIVKFTTVPSIPQHIQYKIVSTNETLLTCESCYGATAYNFRITSAEDGSLIAEETTELPHFIFKYNGTCAKFRVSILAQNLAGSSGASTPYEFKQILQHLHNKVLKQAKHDLVEESFIPPLISEIPSSRSKRFEDFIPPRNSGEVVMLFGDQFYGKTAACSYYIQKYQSGNLMIMMDYDKLRHSAEKMDVQAMLHKYMTDLTAGEMGIIYQWMKENSGQVSFVIDNASLPQEFHEKQCSYGDKEDVSVLLYNITRRHRDIFPESQVFCTTSQDSIQGILKPTRAATIIGFNENHIVEMEKQIFGDKDIPDMPLHVRELCSIPSFCKIISQLYANNQADVDLTSVAAVLVEVLSRILSSNSADVNKVKLTQLCNRMREFSAKVSGISHGRVKSKTRKKARRLHTIDEAASSVYTLMTAAGGEDDYTDIVGENYLKALYIVLVMEASGFQKIFSKTTELDIRKHAKLWIMTAGLFRTDTMEKIAKVFKPVFQINLQAGKKRDVMRNFMIKNTESIQHEVYQNHEITLSWLMCCAEMKDEYLQKRCLTEIKIKNDMSPSAVQEVTAFIEDLPKSLCGMVKLKIKENIKPAIHTEIDGALRQNPHGEMIHRESYKKTTARFSNHTTSVQPNDEGTNLLTLEKKSFDSAIGESWTKSMTSGSSLGFVKSEKSVPQISEGSTLSVCLPQDFEENEEYRFNLKSLTDGREVSSQIARKRGVLFENINPGENYRIFASKEIKDGMSKVIASAQIQTCKTITHAGGELNASGCSLKFLEGTFNHDAKVNVSHLHLIAPPIGYLPISPVYKLHSSNDFFHKEMSCNLTTWCHENINAEVFYYEADEWKHFLSTKLADSKAAFQCKQLGVLSVFLPQERSKNVKVERPTMETNVSDDAYTHLQPLTVRQGMHEMAVTKDLGYSTKKMTFDKKGGKIQNGECCATFSPMSFSEEAEVSITYCKPDTCPNLPKEYIRISPIVDFHSSSTFSKPVKCQMPTWCSSNEKNMTVDILYVEGNEWKKLTSVQLTTERKIFFTTNHFTIFAIVLKFAKRFLGVTFGLCNYVYYHKDGSFRSCIYEYDDYKVTSQTDLLIKGGWNISRFSNVPLDLHYKQKIRLKLKCIDPAITIMDWEFTLDDKFWVRSETYFPSLLAANDVTRDGPRDSIKLSYSIDGEALPPSDYMYPLDRNFPAAGTVSVTNMRYCDIETINQQ